MDEYRHPLFTVDEDTLRTSVRLIPREQIVKQLAEAFHRDTEGKIRQALIDMGWTPPPDDASARSAAERP